MDIASSVSGEAKAKRRCQLKVLMCAVLGFVFLCIIGSGGYLIHRKIQDHAGSSSHQPLSAGMFPLPLSALSTLIAPTITNTHQCISARATSMTSFEQSSAVSSVISRTGSTVDQTVDMSADSISPSSPNTNVTNPITETYTPVSNQSPTYTSSVSVISRQEETTSINHPIQTSTDVKATTNTPQMFSTGSTAPLPSDISKINSDPCLKTSPDFCNSFSGIFLDVCECDADGMWTIIQKRLDGTVDFYLNWTDYKEGFGDVTGEYWLGNEAIHHMTSQRNYSLKVVLKEWDDVIKYAKYGTFRVADEVDNYRLTIGVYAGNAGNSMAFNNDCWFSTKDRDNDRQIIFDCAEDMEGGWWYGDGCGESNLNGQYYTDRIHRTTGINWEEWYFMSGFANGFSFKETKMMLQIKI